MSGVARLMSAAAVAVLTMGQSPAVPVRSALEPASTGGIEVVDRALAKLATHRRLLLIGAHPDDEDTSLLTLVSRGMGGEAAYLAISRGDGGQNLIGTELGEGLGHIRTQELLAARRIDGARQFFTRAFDFGYTRSLDETLERWPREVLLEDAARVVWRFRPQVVVAMFSPEIGGHGQHLASGWTSQEIFRLASEEDRFPALVAEGAQPWQPTALFRRTWFDPERSTFEVPLGGVEGLSGRSMLQLAMQSRSQHRSQDMGMLQPLGARQGGLEWVAGGEGPETDDLFAGVDTRLRGIAKALPEGVLRGRVGDELAEVEVLARDARSTLSPVDLTTVIPVFVQVLERLGEAATWVEESDAAGAVHVAELLAEKIEVAEAGLAAAAGIALEAVGDREAVAPGVSSEVRASVWSSSDEHPAVEVEVLEVEIESSSDWSVERRELEKPEEWGVRHWGFTVAPAASASPSMPYYVERPRQGDLYDWEGVDPEIRGEPYQAPELIARFLLRIGGQPIELLREVVHRSRDQALGEVRRPIRIVPAIELRIEPQTMLWDVDSLATRWVRATVRSNLEAEVSGEIRASGGEAWGFEATPFTVSEAGGEATVDLRLEPSGAITAGRHGLRFAAVASAGESSNLSLPMLEYPHIRPTPMPVEARLDISALDLELPDVGPVGYVRGASDRLPELLRQIGVKIELLDGATLSAADLSRYEVIVIGSRAYETDSALAAANARLLDFVRAGGRLIVQYQQYQFVRGGFAPWVLEISRPHDRITDETAPVRLLQPDHPIFQRPNQLTEEDWHGWVQERGLYFANTWGDEFEPLLAMADPGGEEKLGGLLMGRLGEGVYVYTGLAFFRQLPAGVAGGYRLLANLLAVE